MDHYYNRIVEYYNQCQDDYELVWHLKTHYCMHYGYWEEDTRRLRDALLNMNDKVAQFARIRKGQQVIDMGCGVGGTAVYIAGKYNCDVHGISISTSQIAQAAQFSLESNTTGVHFTIQDYCNTNFEDESFHVAYAIESACYAVDKAVLLKEAFRILKKNGKIVIIDFFWKRTEAGEKDRKLMKSWTDSWSILDYAYEDDFERDLEEAGFVNIQKQNCNAQIWPCIKRLYIYFYPGIICDFILRLLRQRGKLHHKNTWSAYYQYAAFRKGLWNYNIYCAEKL